MWICSKLGFFSVVRKPDGLFHIRARRRQDLENLVAGCKAPPVIHESDPQADYRFRIVCRELTWFFLAEVLMESVDYPNFKGQIASDPDQRDKNIGGSTDGLTRLHSPNVEMSHAPEREGTI